MIIEICRLQQVHGKYTGGTPQVHPNYTMSAVGVFCVWWNEKKAISLQRQKDKKLDDKMIFDMLKKEAG